MKTAAWRLLGATGLLLAVFGLAGCRQAALEPFQVPPGSLVYYVPVSEKVVALTFDDGPNDPCTSAILDILKAENTKATFFLIGKNVENMPETARRIVKEGHAVGSHSYDHPRFDQISEEQMRDQLARAGKAIQSVTGVRPDLFRPPFGLYGTNIDVICRELGYRIAGWSASASDWNPCTSEEVARRILNRACPGAIFLLHDGYVTHPGADRWATVGAVKLIVKDLKARGYRFVTIPELLGLAQRPLVAFRNGVQLLGYHVSPAAGAPGAELRMSFYWRVPRERRGGALAAFVHVLNSRGTLFQADHDLPSSVDVWHETVDVPCKIPPGAAAGPYEIEVGLYPLGHLGQRSRAAFQTPLKSLSRAVVLPERLEVLKAGTQGLQRVE
jgi:peptidoglycan-N-acetylglucosamine deacetylase